MSWLLLVLVSQSEVPCDFQVPGCWDKDKISGSESLRVYQASFPVFCVRVVSSPTVKKRFFFLTALLDSCVFVFAGARAATAAHAARQGAGDAQEAGGAGEGA